VKVKVEGVKLDGRTQAWLTLSKGSLVAIVQPFRSKAKYIVTLKELVEMIAWRAAKQAAVKEKK